MDAIYARQSIDKKDSLSIEEQIDLCKRCVGDDVRIFQDKGFSGKNTKRPAFTELMAAVEAGQIQKIAVYRLDRFSRSIADFSRVWELLRRHNVEFQSVTERFDTSSSMGMAVMNIVLVFAQLERETTAERVKDNYIHRFTLGAWPGGPAPYGFELVKIMDDGRKVSSLAANDKAETVRAIFEAYAEPGTSLRSIAKSLTAKGVRGPKREVWDNVTLSRILHSPLYVRADEDIYWHYIGKGLQIQQEARAFDGVHACNVIGRRDRSKNKYNSIDGQYLTVANHEGLIDSHLWLQVQEKLAENPQISRANAGKYTWLTGLLKCGKCGYAVKVNYMKAEHKRYLICSGRSNLSICDAKINVDLRELESYIAGAIQQKLQESTPSEIYTGGYETAAAVLEIDQKITRLLKALEESCEVSTPYVIKEIERLDKEKRALAKKGKTPSEAIKAIDFDTLSFEEKKIIAPQFIDRILLDGDSANIIWKV